MSDTERHAQCMCGALSATTRGEPAHVMTCSCLDCRRKSGSAFSVSTYWPEDQVTLSGRAESWTRPAPGGRDLTYFFCPVCGVSLYWRAGFAADKIGIGGGNFDDCAFAAPRRAYWTEGRPDWVLKIADVPCLDRQ